MKRMFKVAYILSQKLELDWTTHHPLDEVLELVSKKMHPQDICKKLQDPQDAIAWDNVSGRVVLNQQFDDEIWNLSIDLNAEVMLTYRYRSQSIRINLDEHGQIALQSSGNASQKRKETAISYWSQLITPEVSKIAFTPEEEPTVARFSLSAQDALCPQEIIRKIEEQGMGIKVRHMMMEYHEIKGAGYTGLSGSLISNIPAYSIYVEIVPNCMPGTRFHNLKEVLKSKTDKISIAIRAQTVDEAVDELEELDSYFLSRFSGAF